MDLHFQDGVGEVPVGYQPLLEDFLAGKRSALARAISVVENERPGFQALLHTLHSRIGRAHRIGITGPPGAGKSTLSSALIARYRARGETVGVVAVDPTSPFTGGALLGDRIRMAEAAADPGVFVRSMATRGSLGGLAVTTNEVADLLDAFGFDRLLIETVGVGQSELDIAGAADSTVVVLVPESGDSIQAMKAGLMEISDLFVINKADRPGAERLARDIELMLHLRAGDALRNVPAHHGVQHTARPRAAAGAGGPTSSASAPAPGSSGPATSADGRTRSPSSTAAPGSAPARERGTEVAPWEIPVLRTVADKGEGVDELVEALGRHADWLERTGERARRRRTRAEARVRDAVARAVIQQVWHDRGGAQILADALGELEAGSVTPYQVAARIVRETIG